MLNTKPEKQAPVESELWNDSSRNSLSLGCSACKHRKICGGMYTSNPSYDCLDRCCEQPNECDSVCLLNQPDFAKYVWEIDGFELSNVPRVGPLPAPPLPSIAPLVYHGYSRKSPFAPDAVCLRLYDLVFRSERFATLEDLADFFKFEPGIPLILTGTSQDPELEKWWGLGEPTRRRRIRKLKRLGVDLVTTPNFSMFLDRPRWDDLHSMKRIAITHAEFQSEGIAAALHLNGSAEHDWERWADYINQRDEVSHVAFEFGTGSRHADRARWHTKQLVNLAKSVTTPLHLVIRGGRGTRLRVLCEAFDRVVLLDTDLHMKTHKRQRVEEVTDGRPVWKAASTEPNEPLDELLEDNWLLVRIAHGQALAGLADRGAA